jgi:dihydrofolate reductase
LILSAIAAMSRNRVIGKDNKLIWHIPEDLRYFKDKTKSRVLIMGRKTYESLVAQVGGPLPGRFHIVITRNQSYDVHDPMVEVVSSLGHAMELAHMLTDKYKQKFSDEVFIIGGSEIYAQSLDLIHRLYLTVIEQDYEGDAYFPEFSEKDLVLKQKEDRLGPPPFAFLIYERNN